MGETFDQMHIQCVILGEIVLGTLDRLREELIHNGELRLYQGTTIETGRRQVVEYLIALYYRQKANKSEVNNVAVVVKQEVDPDWEPVYSPDIVKQTFKSQSRKRKRQSATVSIATNKTQNSQGEPSPKVQKIFGLNTNNVNSKNVGKTQIKTVSWANPDDIHVNKNPPAEVIGVLEMGAANIENDNDDNYHGDYNIEEEYENSLNDNSVENETVENESESVENETVSYDDSSIKDENEQELDSKETIKILETTSLHNGAGSSSKPSSGKNARKVKLSKKSETQVKTKKIMETTYSALETSIHALDSSQLETSGHSVPIVTGEGQEKTAKPEFSVASGLLKCEEEKCKFMTKNKISLRNHVKRNHSDSKKIKCNICPYKAIFKSEIAVHMKIHTGESKEICNICGKKYASKSGLNNHLVMVHHKHSKYQCAIDACGKNFSRKDIYVDHIKSHMDIDAYTCSVCDKSFATKPSFYHHVKRCHHGNNIVNFCNICNKKFKVKCDLVQHKQKHSIESFKCVICNKVYKFKSGLCRHAKTCRLHA